MHNFFISFQFLCTLPNLTLNTKTQPCHCLHQQSFLTENIRREINLFWHLQGCFYEILRLLFSVTADYDEGRSPVCVPVWPGRVVEGAGLVVAGGRGSWWQVLWLQEVWTGAGRGNTLQLQHTHKTHKVKDQKHDFGKKNVWLHFSSIIKSQHTQKFTLYIYTRSKVCAPLTMHMVRSRNKSLQPRSKI